jgi:hypothetical protein
MPSSFKLVGPFRVAKAGHAGEECEDAADFDLQRGRFAIADGASESAFAGLWARLLVRAFVAAPAGPDRWAWLPAARLRWAAEVSVKPLAWFTQNKVGQGDFATFLGLTVGTSDGRGPPPWQACAVGDSCLFHVREGRLRHAFPLGRSEQFGNSPCLVGSHDAPLRSIGERQGHCWEGDQLWLMTDALARWFLREVEAGRRPWAELAALRLDSRPEPAAFAAWVEWLRVRRNLGNDDVTLLGVLLG